MPTMSRTMKLPFGNRHCREVAINGIPAPAFH